LEVYRARIEFTTLCQMAVELSRRWRADHIIIEDKVTGTAMIQHLAAMRVPGIPRPIAFQPKEDKITRLVAETPTVEAGQVYLRGNAEWLEDLRRELMAFPNGKNDDQVDSMSQFLSWARQHRAPSFGTVPIRGR
jgi:predicted phage terminase large subunit-like protein